MYVNLYKIIESYTGNFIYIYIVKNKKNIYIKKMKLLLYEFYLKYNINDNFINHEFVKRLEINQYGKIKLGDIYVTPNQYFDIYILFYV